MNDVTFNGKASGEQGNLPLVLIADDLSQARITLKSMLLTMGVAEDRIISVNNGREAHEKLFHNEDISVVISDYNMPVNGDDNPLNGLEILTVARNGLSMELLILHSEEAGEPEIKKKLKSIGAIGVLKNDFCSDIKKEIASALGVDNKPTAELDQSSELSNNL